jgi:hypothetical protein
VKKSTNAWEKHAKTDESVFYELPPPEFDTVFKVGGKEIQLRVHLEILITNLNDTALKI